MTFAIPSSGDPEADRRQLERFVAHDALIQRGDCPNGCGGMHVIDSHNAQCLRCYFSYFCANGLDFSGVARA